MSAFALTRRYHFSAGHRLESQALGAEDNARIYGQCYRQHGHNYHVEVTVAGGLDPAAGMSVDLGIVDAAVKTALLDRVDHHDLSATVPELDGVVTTGENLARLIWELLHDAISDGQLAKVGVVETRDNYFEYAGTSLSY